MQAMTNSAIVTLSGACLFWHLPLFECKVRGDEITVVSVSLEESNFTNPMLSGFVSQHELLICVTPSIVAFTQLTDSANDCFA